MKRRLQDAHGEPSVRAGARRGREDLQGRSQSDSLAT